MCGGRKRRTSAPLPGAVPNQEGRNNGAPSLVQEMNETCVCPHSRQNAWGRHQIDHGCRAMRLSTIPVLLMHGCPHSFNSHPRPHKQEEDDDDTARQRGLAIGDSPRRGSQEWVWTTLTSSKAWARGHLPVSTRYVRWGVCAGSAGKGTEEGESF